MGGEVDRPGRALAPFEHRGEGVDQRRDPLLPAAGPAELEEVPTWLRRGVAWTEIDLHDPLRSCIAQVGPDPLQGVAVGVEEEAAVPRADKVDELGDRQLGLAIARAAGDVGEEGVGGAHPDHPLGAVGADLAERDHVRLALCERRQIRWRREQRARPGDVVGDAVDARRLQEAGHLAGGEDRPSRRAKSPVSIRRSKRARRSGRSEPRKASPRPTGRGRATSSGR